MSPVTRNSPDLDKAVARARQARRVVSSQREYDCGCGFRRRSWVDLKTCPACGNAGLERAVVAAFVS